MLPGKPRNIREVKTGDPGKGTFYASQVPAVSVLLLNHQERYHNQYHGLDLVP
jgi:hypothetical protein